MFTRDMAIAGGKVQGARNAERLRGNTFWGRSMKNRKAIRVLLNHNPKHVYDLHLKSPNVMASYLRQGKPLVSKGNRKDDE